MVASIAAPDLPPLLLRSFLAVVESRSFTDAGLRLGLRQSTISQHVRKLEALVARRLFERDTHSVALTGDGDAMVEFARNILEAHERMHRFFARTDRRERLRVGISEDFAMSKLAEVLAPFRESHPQVDLELTVGLSGYLYQRFDAGDLDVVFAKRRPGDKRGLTAWRERPDWISRPGFALDPDLPVPLIAYSPPSITRSLAIDALEKAGRSWRMACSSGSLSGITAAAMAGLGLAAHSTRLIPAGLARMPVAYGLPRLAEIEFVAIGPGRPHVTANSLVEALVAHSGRLQRPGP